MLSFAIKRIRGRIKTVGDGSDVVAAVILPRESSDLSA